MVPERYPPASFEPVSYAPKAGPLADSPLGWVLHVQAGRGDPGPWFASLVKPNRKFSHLWLSTSGVWRQYGSLRGASWAQVGGDGAWWSVETEGYPGEALTDEQLDALARWHVWSGATDAAATSPSGRGIGTHSMGGAAWGGHECPGSVRSSQRAEILRRAAVVRAHRLVLRRVLQLASPMLRGADVEALQRAVGAGPDGVFGPATAAAVRAWQARCALTADGAIGPIGARSLGWIWA